MTLFTVIATIIGSVSGVLITGGIIWAVARAVARSWQMAATDKRIDDLGKALHIKDELVDAQTVQIKAQDAKIAALEAHVKLLQAQIEALNEALAGRFTARATVDAMNATPVAPPPVRKRKVTP